MKPFHQRALSLYLATTLASVALSLVAALPQPARAGPAAEAPGSIMSLLNALPELPTQAQHATAWVDPRGRLVHAGWLGLDAALDTHREAVARIARADAVEQHRQGTIVGDDLMQGMAQAGIDVQRLQSDPAYQRQTQERLRRMTPAEQMALAKAINQPLNADRRVVNAAQAMADDSPAARAAADAGQAYVQQQPARLAAQQSLWQQAEQAVQRVLAQPLHPGLPKPAMAYDNIGCDNACQGRWHAYADRMLPLLLARDTEVLLIRRAALARHRALVAAELDAADRHLRAAQFGAASRSSAHIGRIVAYDGAAVAEVQGLLMRAGEIVKSAAIVAHCGRQIVLVPAAVCS